MAKKSRSILAFILLIAFGLSLLPRFLYADFQLLDAIEEFGEKRFIKPLPTRLHAGPLRFHPLLRSKVTYDDNILLEGQDKREDVVFNIQPGAIVELPLGRSQITTGYQADFEIFSKSRHARQKDQNQNFFTLVDLNFPNWYVNILENFAETSSRSGTTFSERIPRFDQSIYPKAGYKWKRTTFEAGFRHFVRDFRRQIDDPFDFQIVEWTGVFYYDLFARLKALLEYQFAQIDYDDDFRRKGNFNQIRTGFDGEIIPNLTAKFRVGAQLRNYVESTRANGGEREDFNSWVGSFSLEYKIRPNIKLKTSFSRQAVEATFFDINFYKEHLFTIGAEYEFRPKWTIFSNFKYYHHRYGEDATADGQSILRRDHHAGVDAGLRYKMQDWVEFEIAYLYLRRNSNFPGQDFTDNQFSLTTVLKY
ncbi:MAG: outer membrane beta-barrel protein [Candidatus Omnitrophica bacterium]|nr:outer membrane beta-barrel protein [Candidatus Omnitrophota bacterium]